MIERERTIRKVPCLDLGIKQLRRVGEDGDTARGSEKETKPHGTCGDLFCSRGYTPVAGTKLTSVVYLFSLTTSSKARKPWQWEGSW